MVTADEVEYGGTKVRYYLKTLSLEKRVSTFVTVGRLHLQSRPFVL